MINKENAALEGKSPPETAADLISEYGNYVYTIVFSRLRNCGTSEDIEECVSDVFIEAARDIGSSEFYSGDLKAAMGTLAKRRAINYYNRLSANNSKRTVIPEDMDSGENLILNAERRDIQRKILSAVEALGKPDSEILLLKYYYCMSAGEISKRVGMSSRNVQKHAERALERLGELLEERGIRRNEI